MKKTNEAFTPEDIKLEECDMSMFKSLVNPELLDEAIKGNCKAQFKIGLIALRNGRLGYAEIFLSHAYKNLN